jgi:hypothetical protein
MKNVICFHFTVQVIDIPKHNDAKCHLNIWVAITMYFGGWMNSKGMALVSFGNFVHIVLFIHVFRECDHSGRFFGTIILTRPINWPLCKCG